MTDESKPTISVGSRVEAKGARGTARYVGELPNHGSTVWVGIEWDEEGRGKHDGSTDGVRYFECAEGKGSFVKADKVSMGMSFAKSLISRYNADGYDHSENDLYAMTANNRKMKIELCGMDKMKKKQSQFEKLRIVSVADGLVMEAGGENEVREMCPIISELDMSRNLFVGWEEIGKICKQLEHLELLILTGNPLGGQKISEAVEKNLLSSDMFGSLKTLVLNETGIQWAEIVKLAPFFPKLEQIHLCGNKISHIEPAEGKDIVLPSTFPSLKLVNFENNNLSNWEDLWRFNMCPGLERIIANQNQISTIFYHGVQPGENRIPPFSKLQSILLCDNKVNDWESINQLNNFPSIRDLRLNNNTLFESVGVSMCRMMVIARVGTLTQLNGAEVRPMERADSERLYMRRCQEDKEKPDFSALHPRYQGLFEKYGDIFAAKKDQGTSLKDNVVSVTIESRVAVSINKKPATRPVPLTMTVGKLRLLCKQLMKVEPSKQKLFYVSGDGMPFPEPLDDDFKELSYYGLKDGTKIIIEEYDEEFERKAKERDEKLKEEKFEKQLKDVDDLTKHRANEVSKGITAAGGAGQERPVTQ